MGFEQGGGLLLFTSVVSHRLRSNAELPVLTPAVIVITTTIIITAVITIAAVAIVVIAIAIAIAATPATLADQTSDWAEECAIRTAACVRAAR
jgi:hypothetical protein